MNRTSPVSQLGAPNIVSALTEAILIGHATTPRLPVLPSSAGDQILVRVTLRFVIPPAVYNVNTACIHPPVVRKDPYGLLCPSNFTRAINFGINIYITLR